MPLEGLDDDLISTMARVSRRTTGHQPRPSGGTRLSRKPYQARLDYNLKRSP